MKHSRMKKITVCLMVLIMVISQFSFTFAARPKPTETSYNYVALGDSIPFGISYEYSLFGSILDSYTDKLSRVIDATPQYKVNYKDLSASGGNAIDVYNQVMADSGGYIKNADLITLCIGANDLMDAAKRNPSGTIDFYNIDWNLVKQGRAEFERLWPQIIAQIELINPDVKLLVMTIYNPYNKNDLHTYYNPMSSALPIHDEVDQYFSGGNGINTIIKGYVPKQNTMIYRVVDVYSKFETSYTNSKGSVTGFYGSFIKDPHPDKNGQTQIFNLHQNMWQ